MTKRELIEALRNIDDHSLIVIGWGGESHGINHARFYDGAVVLSETEQCIGTALYPDKE